MLENMPGIPPIPPIPPMPPMSGMPPPAPPFSGRSVMETSVVRTMLPIDAAFWAVEKITGVEMVCKEFQVQAATIGRDAQGEASVQVEHKSRLYRGRGVSTDTVAATIKAILNAVNRIVLDRGEKEQPSSSQSTG